MLIFWIDSCWGCAQIFFFNVKTRTFSKPFIGPWKTNRLVSQSAYYFWVASIQIVHLLEQTTALKKKKWKKQEFNFSFIAHNLTSWNAYVTLFHASILTNTAFDAQRWGILIGKIGELISISIFIDVIAIVIPCR